MPDIAETLMDMYIVQEKTMVLVDSASSKLNELAEALKSLDKEVEKCRSGIHLRKH